MLLTLYKEVMYLTENSWLSDHLITKIPQVRSTVTGQPGTRFEYSLMMQLQCEMKVLNRGFSHHQQTAGGKRGSTLQKNTRVPTPESGIGTEGMRSGAQRRLLWVTWVNRLGLGFLKAWKQKKEGAEARHLHFRFACAIAGLLKLSPLVTSHQSSNFYMTPSI